MSDEEGIPFWQSKTFWLSVLTLAAGVALVMTGHEDVGALLLAGGAVGGGFALVKGGGGPKAATGVVLVVVLALCACTPTQAFAEAEKATYDAIAPEYLQYVRSDPALSSEEVARREALIRAWLVDLDAVGGVAP
jgi:hypothetical protein